MKTSRQERIYLELINSVLKISLLVLLSTMGRFVWAAPVTLDFSKQNSFFLKPHSAYLEDSSASLSLAQVIEADRSGFFTLDADKPLTAAALNSVYWLRVDLLPTLSTAKPQIIWLGVLYDLLDEFVVYQGDKRGDYVPLSLTRDTMRGPNSLLEEWGFILPLELKAGEVTRLYLRIDPTFPLISVPLYTFSEEGYRTNFLLRHSIRAAFYMVMISFIAYNLILFIALRDRAYLSYLVWMASVTGFMGMVDGVIWIAPLDGFSNINSHFLTLLLALLNIAYLWFANTFLGISRNSLTAGRCLKLLMVMLGLCIPLGIFFHARLAFMLLQIANPVVLFGTWLYAFYLMISKRSLLAGYFFTAELMLVVMSSFRQLIFYLPALDHTVLYFMPHVGIALEAIMFSLGLAYRINIMRQAKEQAEQESRIDGLTLVANRRHFEHRLSEEIQRASRSGSPLSLLMLDIDFFKQFNDCYGHAQGDQCLRDIAQTLRDSLSRPSDLVARYGGEEFAVLLPDTDSVGAQGIAESLMPKIHQLDIEHRDSPVCECVTVSIGAYSIVPESSASNESLINLADKNLYQAKEQGRNCCICQ